MALISVAQSGSSAPAPLGLRATSAPEAATVSAGIDAAVPWSSDGASGAGSAAALGAGAAGGGASGTGAATAVVTPGELGSSSGGVSGRGPPRTSIWALGSSQRDSILAVSASISGEVAV